MIPPTSLEDRITRLLGDRYELIELLGKGGFASVFRVRSRRLGRTEALKVLSEALTEDSDFAKRFEQEARVAASLDHPHIVKVYDYGAADDFVWFSMQFVDGPTVGRELRMRESFDDPSAARIAMGVLDALQYSHARGVIHRDIKPDNILLDRDTRPYLTDFGVAKSQAGLVKTHAGTLLGSPAYMSPEQLQGKALDGRSDIYSLGVTLYKMLAGGLPFTADDTFRATMKRLSEPPEPLSTRRPEVNPVLAEIVMRSLERDPDQRYPDAATMREELEGFLVDVTPPRVRLSSTATRTDGPTPTGFSPTLSKVTPLSSQAASLTGAQRATAATSSGSSTATLTPTTRTPLPQAPTAIPLLTPTSATSPPPPPPVIPPPPAVAPAASASSAAGPRPVSPALKVFQKFPPLAWAGLALAALVIVGLIAIFARRPSEPAPESSPAAAKEGAAPALTSPPSASAPAATVPRPAPSPVPSEVPTAAAPALAAEEPTAAPAPTASRPRRTAPPRATPQTRPSEPTPVAMGPARPPKTMAEAVAIAPIVLAPDVASKHHNESVGLKVTVGADGSVTNAKVISEVCPECDRAALDAIRRSHFKPAQDADGKPMESTLALALRIP